MPGVLRVGVVWYHPFALRLVTEKLRIDELRGMKLHYYADTDSLYVECKSGPSAETREVADGLNVDLDADGDVVGFDIDQASKRLELSTLETKVLPRPEALLVHLDDELRTEQDIRRALATALYRDGSLSLGRAAKFSGLAIAEFIGRLSRCGIPVVRGTSATVADDAEAIDEWRNALSRPVKAR